METNLKKRKRKKWLEKLQFLWKVTKTCKFNANIGEIYEVDFGENVGDEFSGLHLAICLKESKLTEETMLVVPLTTKYRQLNIREIIDVPSRVRGQRIKAGVCLGNAMYVSKRRVNISSIILKEKDCPGNGYQVAVGYMRLTAEQIEKYRRLV